MLFCYKIKSKIRLYFRTKSPIFSRPHRIFSLWRPFATADYNWGALGACPLAFLPLFYTTWSPDSYWLPQTHIPRTHTDTLLTLFLAFLTVIRVELGVRGSEHMRVGEAWYHML